MAEHVHANMEYESTLGKMARYQCRGCRAVGEWNYSRAREIPLVVDDSADNTYYAQFKRFEVMCTCSCGYVMPLQIQRLKHSYEQ